jgi:GAF domain-containing protein
MQVKVHDHCFSENFAGLYQQGRVHAIADIYQVNFKDCYVEILRQFQVQANVVVPLLQGNQLWGLLVHQLALRLRHSRTSWAVRSALSITASDFA